MFCSMVYTWFLMFLSELLKGFLEVFDTKAGLLKGFLKVLGCLGLTEIQCHQKGLLKLLSLLLSKHNQFFLGCSPPVR